MGAIAYGHQASPNAIALINKHRYRETFGLSSKQFDQEPVEDINLAFAVWKADEEKQAMDEKRNKQKARTHGKR